jgi:hypothetical protein
MLISGTKAVTEHCIVIVVTVIHFIARAPLFALVMDIDRSYTTMVVTSPLPAFF